ncbi:MAG: hypothetical protein KC620_23805, partial [Myxococcales bacterium]|nr:hypothetical protein [Myxococcales bacterium]
RGDAHADPTDVVEQVETSRPVQPGVGPFYVFARPNAQLWAQVAEGRGYAIARPIIYVDLNGDRRWNADEPLIGETPHALVLAARDLGAEEAPSGRPLTAGYHRTEFPFPCAPPTAPVEPDCNIPLGVGCLNADACGDGTCLADDQGFPGGYCAGVPPACRPPDAAGEVVNGPTRALDYLRWVRACTTDADCRTTEGYACDPLTGACLVDDGFQIVIGRAPSSSICSDVGNEPREGPPTCTEDADCAATCPPEAPLGCACLAGPMPQPLCLLRCAEDADCAHAPGPPGHVCVNEACILRR